MTARIVRGVRLAPAALVALVWMAGNAWAQQAGEVEFSRGVGFAQAPGQVPRTLGKGLPLREGDRLTTSDSGSAIIRLEDGTRMTVRPNSELVLQQYQYRQGAADNSMLMQLVRGGFRAVTGLIAKGSPNAARIQTSTATIGIRGTDFDARLCARDCAAESQRVAATARPNAVQASAKIVSAEGTVEAVDASGQRRRLVDGGSVYPGDVVETATAARAVMAFRDDTRITLGGTTRFRVDNFVYDEKNAGEGRFLVSVLRGSVRALTGLIAKANNRNVGFATATATIGIRGTGVDIVCEGECANEPGADTAGLSVFNWLGSVAITQTGQSEFQVLQAGQGLFIARGVLRPFDTPPVIDGPRPDTVIVPPKLFLRDNVAEGEEGLFLLVRDGHIEVLTAGDVLHLGRGEAGHVGGNGIPARPITIPLFLDFDRFPLPTSRNPNLISVLQDAGIRPVEQCR